LAPETFDESRKGEALFLRRLFKPKAVGETIRSDQKHLFSRD